MSLRTIPDLCVVRPADANETAAAWRLAVDHDGPVALVLTRQDVPVLDGTSVEGVARGGYVLHEPADGVDVVLVGTGSEVALCVDTAELLAGGGVRCRVVSMPSWDRFAAQDRAYRDEVLPPETPSLSVEAGVTLGWDRWVDTAHGLDRFGTSAPGAVAMERLGFNPDAVAESARRLLA
jgi:transketolase